MKHDSRIFLAGHNGMVGSAIHRQLIRQGYRNVITRDRSALDLARQSDVEDFFMTEKPEYVIIAAAKVGGIMANSTYSADFIYQNIMIAANIINSSYQSGVTKLLNLGSSCIYPRMAPQPMNEESLLTGPLEGTNEAYAIAKIAAIKFCRYYNQQYGTNYISLMPTNMYGINDNFNLFTSHVLPAMLRKFHLAKLLMQKRFDAIRQDIRIFDNNPNAPGLSEGELENYCHGNLVFGDTVGIWGTGKPMREFLFVDDCAEACIFLMNGHDYSSIGEHVNVGTGEEIAIGELANLIKDIVGYQGGIQFDSEKPDGTPRKLLDVSRIHSLGWKHATSLEEGIRQVYQWYLDRVDSSL